MFHLTCKILYELTNEALVWLGFVENDIEHEYASFIRKLIIQYYFDKMDIVSFSPPIFDGGSSCIHVTWNMHDAPWSGYVSMKCSPAFVTWLFDFGQERIKKDLSKHLIECKFQTFNRLPIPSARWRRLMQDIRSFSFTQSCNTQSSHP